MQDSRGKRSRNEHVNVRAIRLLLVNFDVDEPFARKRGACNQHRPHKSNSKLRKQDHLNSPLCDYSLSVSVFLESIQTRTFSSLPFTRTRVVSPTPSSAFMAASTLS